MNSWHISSALSKVPVMVGMVALLVIAGCSGQTSSSPETAASKTSQEKNIPLHGKVKQAKAPANAVFGMIWVNTGNNREYIFDGSRWAPHDKSVDTFYGTGDSIKTVQKALTRETGESCSSYDCNPGGAHRKHASYDCKTCHMMHGKDRFDPNGLAAIKPTPTNPNPLKPSFNATAKTCANIACHSIPAGTFSYYFIGGDGEPALNTVNYGGTLAAVTPSWYTIGAGCGACHGNPPRNGSDGSNVWHSGYHAGTSTAASNQCQFCHPGESGTGGQGTTIVNPALHGNGKVEVQAIFKSSCFSCH